MSFEFWAVIDDMELRQPGTRHCNRDLPFRFRRRCANSFFLDPKYIFAYNAHCCLTFIIRVIDLGTVYQSKIPQGTAGIDQRSTDDLIRGLSVRFRRQIAPPPYAIVILPEMQIAPGDSPLLGFPVFFRYANCDPISGEDHIGPAVLYDPVINIRSSHQEFMVFIDQDRPGLLIEIVT